jgi:hypothetical protein
MDQHTPPNWWDHYLVIAETLLIGCPADPLMRCLSASAFRKDRRFVETTMINWKTTVHPMYSNMGESSISFYPCVNPTPYGREMFDVLAFAYDPDSRLAFESFERRLQDSM